jgi:hypothetical protein
MPKGELVIDDATGARACVPKPFRREGVIATVEAALAHTHCNEGQAGSW